MEKFRIYLDANIIYGFFLAKVKFLKGKVPQFVEPKIIGFLKLNLQKMDLFVSCVAKAEIFRRLKTEWDLDTMTIFSLWNELKTFINIDEIDEVVVTDEIVTIVSKEKFKKRITNIIHLVSAKNNDLYFITGDKEIVSKCKKFYPKTLSYIELRNLLEGVEN